MKTAILAAVLAGLALGGCQTIAQRTEDTTAKVDAVWSLAATGKIKYAEAARRSRDFVNAADLGHSPHTQAYWAKSIVNAGKLDQGLITKDELDALDAEANSVREHLIRTEKAMSGASRPRTCIRTDDFVNCF